MTAQGDRVRARGLLVTRVLRYVAAEYAIGSDEKAAAEAVRLEAEVELAARDLTGAVDDVGPSLQPRGWAITPDVKP